MATLGFHCHGMVDFEASIVANNLRHGEFFNLPPAELPVLKQKVRQYKLEISIHCPLTQTPWYPDPPTWAFLCDLDGEKRELNFRLITDTLEKAKGLPTTHIVAHFPSPSTTPLDGTSPDRQEEIVWQSAGRLSDLSTKYGIPIHVEGFGPTPFLSVPFLTRVFTSFPRLRYCFDTGHMCISSQRDGFDIYRFAEGLAPFIGSLHLWNTRRVEDYNTYRHIPVHPGQKPEQGWVDIERILRETVPVNPSMVIIFESGLDYPEALGGFNYKDGVKWVKELVAGLS